MFESSTSEPRSDRALVELGYERFRALFHECAQPPLVPARVVKTVRGHVWVATNDGVIRALPAGALTSEAGPEGFPVVGDWVALRPGDGASSPVVEVVLPRRSLFTRRDPGKASVGQVIAANIDIVFIVQAIDGGANIRRIERELALAWDSGAVPVVVLSKADLVEDPDAEVAAVSLAAPGVDVIASSVPGDVGIEVLRAHVADFRTVALIGPSGAGKSTLVNRLVGGDVQSVGEVRAIDGRGRHTTVTRELIPLPGGGALIDTPGLRAVAMWGDEEGVETTFAEIAELGHGCRYDDCAHEVEPGCAVRAAVESGGLDPARYEAYLALRRESAFQARQGDARLKAEETRRWKMISKASKAYFKDKYSK